MKHHYLQYSWLQPKEKETNAVSQQGTESFQTPATSHISLARVSHMTVLKFNRAEKGELTMCKDKESKANISQ